MKFVSALLAITINFMAVTANRDTQISTDRSKAAQSNVAQTICTSELVAAGQTACSATAARSSAQTEFEQGAIVTAYVSVRYNRIDRVNGTEIKTPIRLGAQFFPKVDQLTAMLVPNITGIRQYDPDVRVTVRAKNSKGVETSFSTEYLPFSAGEFMVPYRSVIINMLDGVISSVSWEKTRCTFQNYVCIGDIYADPCVKSNGATADHCDRFKIYTLWAGTDKNKIFLRTSSKSIYRLTMLP